MASDERARIQQILKGHEERISKLESLLKATPEASSKKTSLKEFILSKKPIGDVQRSLAIGYYLETYQGIQSFNVKDLEEGFRTAKEKVPQNIPYKVYRKVGKGHMMEAKEKKDELKAYVLTNSGENHVEAGFTKER